MVELRTHSTLPFLRCDRFLGEQVDGEYPWPIEENRCVFRIGHSCDHLPLRVLAAKLERGANTELARIGGGVVLSREECDALVERVASVDE